MRRLSGLTIAVAALAGALPFSAVAQHRDGDYYRGWRGDIRYFDNHDARHWRSGHWRHIEHEGRLGWWWVLGGMWYFYPQPVYPFPDPYRPPVVVLEQSPPPVVVQAPPPAASPPPQYWYFCETANGYYPYVPACPSGWKKVPAAPAGAPR